MDPYGIPDDMITTPPKDHLQTVKYVKHFDIQGNRVRSGVAIPTLNLRRELVF